MCDAEFGLWVVGESSRNQDEWSIWNEPAFVIARTAEEARQMVDRPGEPCCRIPLDEMRIVAVMPEPNFGEDL